MIEIYSTPFDGTGITNLPISAYSYVSSNDFEVKVFDSNTDSYSSTFVYKCGPKASNSMGWDGPFSVFGYGNVCGVLGANIGISPWAVSSTLRLNYVNFGISDETKIKVRSKRGAITSVDIGPYSKQYNSKYSYLDSSSIEISGIVPYSKLAIIVNNDGSGPLFVFANPLKPSIPTPYVIPSSTSVSAGSPGDTVYFSAGFYELSIS